MSQIRSMLHNMDDYTKIPFLMKIITYRVSTILTRKLSVELITATQARVLMYLLSRDGQLVTQKDVEHYLGVSHTTTKGLVKRLEDKGMVTTAFDNEDGRVKNIYLTEKSRATHKEVKAQINIILGSLLKGISEEEKKTLYNLLHRMYDNIV